MSGLAPHPSDVEQGVVLAGGAQTVLHPHAALSSLPQAFPLNVVPEGQTSAPGAKPHSLASHPR